MNQFCPDSATRLAVGSSTYGFLPHPIIPGEIHAIVREQATTYQLGRYGDGTLWALKVANAGYRSGYIAHTTAILRQYRYLPGLSVGHRLCLTKVTHPELIATYPELEYAILMPWIAGKTWASFMTEPAASAGYSLSQARTLALATAHALWSLEAHRLTHTDMAGDNVVILPSKQIELIDVEGLYIHGTPLPGQRSKGWRGYQHRHLDERGNCRPEGDRFAGAMLLTEMLTWWSSLVRASTPDEYDSLFQLQEREPQEALARRLKVVRRTLQGISPKLRDLFDQAWLSSDLAECPDFATWTLCLLQVQV